MRYVLVIADGCADRPVEALGYKTPLMVCTLPRFDQIAGGLIGTARSVPLGISPGSDTAILTILGYDVRTQYRGRAGLEAAGAGVKLAPDALALRVNLCTIEPTMPFENSVMLAHNGGNIEGDDAQTLMDALMDDATYLQAAQDVAFTLFPSRSFRHIGQLLGTSDEPFQLAEPHSILGEPIEPHLPKGNCASALRLLMRVSFDFLNAHPMNRTRNIPANCLWPWAPGRAMTLPSFVEHYGHQGPVISAVPLMKGIARLAGLHAPDIPGATGDLDTNYEAKVEALLDGFTQGADFGVLHFEGPDECAHAKDVSGKCEALRRIDERALTPLLDALPKIDPDYRIMLLSDHLTLLDNGKHDGAPIPFACYDSRSPGPPKPFDEFHAAQGHFVADGTRLMDLLFEK